MPDRRRHRGAHPRDRELFGEGALPALRAAAQDLAWLSSRGYAPDASLALVGNRYQLMARQRTAVARACCSDAAALRRESRRVLPSDVEGQSVRVDGFNACIAVEVAISGGVILLGRDRACRDLASVHGTYRRVSETPRALALLASGLDALQPGLVTWYFDRPVSNSGTLAGMLRRLLSERSWPWEVELADHVDREVSARGHIAVSADSAIIEAAERWFDLAGHVIEHAVSSAWIVDLWPPDQPCSPGVSSAPGSGYASSRDGPGDPE